MKLLQELHNLHEAETPGDNKIELANLIKHFPNNHKKAIDRLWGGPRLVWNGVPFFGDDGLYGGKLNELIKKAETDIDMEISNIKYSNEEEGEEHDIELTYTAKIDDPNHDGQEVYMGYLVKDDDIYVGYDLSINEEEFNDEWDDAFRDATGEEFEIDNKAHYKAFEAAHEQFKEMNSAWGLYRLAFVGDELTAELHFSGHGLFYGHGKHANSSGMKKAQELGLLDLRLD